MVSRLIIDTKYILQVPGFRTESFLDAGSSNKWSSFPAEWKKEKCHPDSWMTYESFPFMRLRMLTLICCHVSVWLKCVCVHELAWEGQKSEKKEKERLRVWWWDFGCVTLLAIKFPMEGSRAVSIYPASIIAHSPRLRHGRCVSRKERDSPTPPNARLLRSFHKRKEGRGSVPPV